MRMLAGDDARAALVVVGEAGVGKSRLISVSSSGVEPEVLVLSGWCLARSESLPFLPLLDVLRASEGVERGSLVQAALARCPAFVADEVLRLMPDLDANGDRSSATRSRSGDQSLLFEALRRVLMMLGMMRRVAIVIEDVQWADTSTLHFLEYLLAPAHDTGVPVVLTFRTEDLRMPVLADWLEALRRNNRVSWLDLPPMTRAETAEQIAMLLGAGASEEFVDGIYMRSEGNAFFTDQLVAVGGLGGAARVGLNSLLLARTAEVDGVAQDVLAGLAAAGRLLAEGDLALLTGRTVNTVRSALIDLDERRLLRRDPNTGRVELRHALLAEAVRGEMLPDERREWHDRVADLLAGWGDAAPAAAIAEHCQAANRPGEELRWRIAAGEQADAVFAAREAANHWGRAVALWHMMPAPEAESVPALAEVYFRALEAEKNAGRGVAAAKMAEEAMERLLPTDDDAVAIRMYWECGYWRALQSAQRGLDTLATAIDIGRRMSPTREYVLSLRRYATLRADQVDCDPRECVGLLEEAVRAADEGGFHKEQRLALAFLAHFKRLAGDQIGSIELVARALAASADRRAAAADTDVVVACTDVLLKLGLLDRVVAVGIEAVRDAELHGYPHARSTCMLKFNICEALIELGRIDRAAELLKDAIDGPITRDSLPLHIAVADLDMCRGRWAAAAAFWGEGSAAARAASYISHRRDAASREAQLRLWLRDPAAALTTTQEVLGPICRTNEAQDAGGLFVLALRACADAADTAHAVGDETLVNQASADAAALDSLARTAKVNPLVSRSTSATSGADQLSWQAEWARLRGHADPAAWASAAAAWDTLGRPHRAAYARWRQGEALLAHRGRTNQGGIVLRTAAMQAAQHVPLRAVIADLARRARVDVDDHATADVAAVATTPFGLTDRELAVLRLLGAGKTNHEIAATLFVSPKTVSVHITRILRKLNADTRVHAATVAARAGLLEAPDRPATPGPSPTRRAT